MATATFGAGCFWCVEETFRMIEGVSLTAVGYCGGTGVDPTYYDVCSGATGHAEVVRLEFDPDVVLYDELLEAFWSVHDPTTLNRQGPDVGTQYRSVIFYEDEKQEVAARGSTARADRSGRFRGKIVTQIVPAAPFYRAEEYHQRYIEKGRRQ